MNLQSLTCTESGGNVTVFVQCTAAWNVTADVDWITFSRSSGSGDNTMTVTIAANNTASERKGIITFAYGNAKTTVNVSQTGEDARLSVEPTSIFVNANGTGESIKISSNTSWTVKAADSWVSYSPSSGNGDATITVSASAYTAGTRYSSLTITDASGKISQEIPVAQAKSREELTLLKSMLEKPLGIVDVDLKTASYTTILDAVKKGYEVSANSSVNSFIVYATKYTNPSLMDFTYQGMTLSMFHYYSYRYNAYSKEERTVGYVFNIDKSKPSDEYEKCRDGILQDFKYNLNATLTKADSSGNLEVYKGTDADNNNYSVVVRNTYRIDIYAYY